MAKRCVRELPSLDECRGRCGVVGCRWWRDCKAAEAVRARYLCGRFQLEREDAEDRAA